MATPFPERVLVKGLLKEAWIPPLFCTAYIRADWPQHAGQEAAVARYPMALIPQNSHPAFHRWRDKVRSYNPGIFLLAYQMVHEETTVPGPGHDELRKVNDAWSVYPDGSVPVVKGGSPKRPSKVFDLRNADWQHAFLAGCRATLNSYPFDGLFLDQCTVFSRTHPSPAVRQEMRAALQDTLFRLRREFPTALIIGNSSFDWSALNGEMCENRVTDWEKELQPFKGHAKPVVQLVQTYLQRPDDVESVEKEMRLVHSYGALYGACVVPQRALWFDVFDRVISG